MRSREGTIRFQRNGWLLNVGVASGWLLLVAGVGILLTPHHLAVAHGAPGKMAATCIFIAAISLLSAQASRVAKAQQPQSGLGGLCRKEKRNRLGQSTQRPRDNRASLKSNLVF